MSQGNPYNSAWHDKEIDSIMAIFSGGKKPDEKEQKPRTLN
jgi:hypothetical protein